MCVAYCGVLSWNDCVLLIDLRVAFVLSRFVGCVLLIMVCCLVLVCVTFVDFCVAWNDLCVASLRAVLGCD